MCIFSFSIFENKHEKGVYFYVKRKALRKEIWLIGYFAGALPHGARRLRKQQC
ncbi:hypothetical protein KSX_01240 [Ktedonospora formicarum]|uniref:Uncharacterized protein n=1 Tax=Ktedonospora formicarum TaxID=2778364 RepID=A0A8J3HRG8_9CHLR|nr:hypothetical protein KSX_01240 [Ktedonospora formicarum]